MLLSLIVFYCLFFGHNRNRRITVGHSTVKRRCGTRYKEIIKDDEIVYIPVLESLEQMLNVDLILKEVNILFINCTY